MERRVNGSSSLALRDDEEFVITSIAAKLSGTWRPGEDPPDAYLILGADTVAVEISTLTQYVTDDRGTRSRLTDDIATLKFANDLNDELKHLVPDGYTIGLVLSSPILELRKTKAQLEKIIRDHLTDLTSLQADQHIKLNGNPIRVYLNHHGEALYKKVSAAFTNRSSNADILANTTQILEDRIVTKTKKCSHILERGPVWLALFNDYWLTEADTYKYALSQMSLEHPFQRILLVNGDRSIDTLFDK
jgi:hypothetical protein